MPKSYRFRTEVGVDKEVRLNIDQDFDFLEILSLKFRQEDLYDRFCADYGVVAGRVVVNGGFGVPNVSVSIFVPLDNIDENDPIISTLYPYRKVTDKNEDGFRYNLLPYVQEYGGHTPTGTFPTRDDVLTRKEVLQVYEKYYRYTVKTNDSGDFMIFGVPLGQQKVVMDLDLSNIGQFSLRPADLIRMGRGVESQFNGQQFKSSDDLNSLPQLVNVVKEIEVYPFWGENDICDVGITRSDFDLRDEGIEIQPTSIFMGSMFSTIKEQYLKGNCKPKNKAGNLCDLETGPGQILALRQTIDVDFSGRPIIEEYKIEEGGNVIDDEGVWMIDLPMNLNYVITNEFGEQILSTDPSKGIPTKGKYRFKIKYQNEGGLEEDVIRANYLVPNIREHGWSGTSRDDRPTEEKRNKSYAFSLNWDDYYDSNAAINCDDSFYEFNYNKVYTVASHIDRFKWGFNRKRHLGIKEINDDTCSSQTSTPPVNDAQRNNNLFMYIFNFILSILTFPLISIIILMHVLAFLYPILRVIINIIIAIVNGIIRTICLIVAVFSPRLSKEDCKEKGMTPLPKENPFKNLALPMLSYPDCEACECSANEADNSSDELDSAEDFQSDLEFGAMFDATIVDNYVSDGDNLVDGSNYCVTSATDSDGNPIGYCPDYAESYRDTTMFDIQQKMLRSGYDNFEKDKFYFKYLRDNDSNWDSGVFTTNNRDENEWYKSPVYPMYKNYCDEDYALRWFVQPNPTWGQALNLMNRRQMYFGDSGMRSNLDIYGESWFTNYGGATQATPISPSTTSERTTNRIQVEAINDAFGVPTTAFPAWTDMCNIFVFDPGTTLKTGTLMTFNDVTQIVDPNIEAYDTPNQFGSKSLTGNTYGSTNGYTVRDVTYINHAGQEITTSVNLVITGETAEYKNKSGVEYFQLITGMTINEMNTLLEGGIGNSNNFSILRRFISQYRTQYQCKEESYISANNECDSNINAAGGIRVSEGADDYLNVMVGFFVRGVDVYTPRQKMRYDLSKLFGYFDGVTTFNGQVKVEGDYYMNIPIQHNGYTGTINAAPSWWSSYKSPVPHYEYYDDKLKFYGNSNDGTDYYSSNLFHTSYGFAPNEDDWQNFTTECFNKYCSLDGQIGDGNEFEGRYTTQYMGGFGTDVVSEEFPKAGINPWIQQGIEGCGYQWTRQNNVNNNFCNNPNKDMRREIAGNAKDVVSVSPLYLPKKFQPEDGLLPNGVPTTNMDTPCNIVFRSDRLPSSDKFELLDNNSDEPEYRRYTLHMNNKQTIFFIDDDGTITTGEGETVGATDDSGNAADEAEDANSQTQAVINSFSCGGMVPLGCYTGSGESFEISQPCYLNVNGEVTTNQTWTGAETLINGCYMFVIKRLFISIPRDIRRLFEWRTRIRFMFALCQGVIGEMFQNNWLNGALYMPAFQKQTLYNSDNLPRRYRYCGDSQQFWEKLRDQGPVYFNTDTNSFYYRSTPFNDETNQFVGQEPGRTRYTGQNKLNIWSPTTIMELGPRDEFTKEIAFSPEFEGYFIDTLTSSSYKDISTIINLFAVARLSNSNFLNQLLGAGDASVGAIFSRELPDGLTGTLLADYISNPFDARVDGDFAQMVSINGEYGVVPYLDGNYPDSITVEDDRFGIWFSSNTANRRIVTQGVTTFAPNVENGPVNPFGYPNSQYVPYYMWHVNDNGVFGTEQNSWHTETIFSSVYQGDDFYDGSGKYMRPDYGYGLGYIYNKSSSDPEFDSYPSNDPNGGNFKVGNPFHFYFGLRRGKTAMNRYIKKYIFNLE